MSSISIPDELYRQANEIAQARHVSVDEVFASVFAEHVAAWQRLRQRASQGDSEAFLAVLDKVPDVESDDSDRP